MSCSDCKLNVLYGYHFFLSPKVYHIKIATSYGVNMENKAFARYLARKKRGKKKHVFLLSLLFLEHLAVIIHLYIFQKSF